MSGSAMPLSGGRRRSRRHRRGGQEPAGGQMPSAKTAGQVLDTAADEANKLGGQKMDGGRRRKMTAKKMVKKLHSLAKQAKKLTLRLKKMKKHH